MKIKNLVKETSDTYQVKVGPGKYAIADKETGEILGFTYINEPTKEELSRDIESFVLDDTGCINGDFVAGLKDEPDFLDLLFDERYDMDDY